MANATSVENIGQLIARQQQELHDAITHWREHLDAGHDQLRKELAALDTERWEETLEMVRDYVARGDESRHTVDYVQYGVMHAELAKRLDELGAATPRGKKPVLLSVERVATNVGRQGQAARAGRILAIIDITDELK